MKIYGYEIDNEKFVKLREVSIESSVDKLDKLIEFLEYVKEQHSKARGMTDICHSHYRDWDKQWTKEDSDLIIISTFDEK